MSSKGEDDDEQEELAPRACQAAACAIQTCIVRFDSKKADPVAHCRPYFDAYRACIEERQDRAKKGGKQQRG